MQNIFDDSLFKLSVLPGFPHDAGCQKGMLHRKNPINHVPYFMPLSWIIDIFSGQPGRAKGSKVLAKWKQGAVPHCLMDLRTTQYRPHLQTCCEHLITAKRSMNVKLEFVLVTTVMLLAFSFPCSAQDGSMAVEINVSLSKKAAAKLAADKEGIVAFASYYGDPSKKGQKHADEMGQIDLSPSEEWVEISGKGGPLRITGKFVDRKLIQWVDGPIKINVNVISARKSSPDNILTCDLIDGALSDAQKAPLAVHCGLTDENPETKTLP